MYGGYAYLGIEADAQQAIATDDRLLYEGLLE